MARRPSSPPPSSRERTRHRKTKRRSWKEKVEASIVAMWQRIDRIEGKRKRIGFQTVNVEGDGIEQDDPDLDYTPEEV